MVDYNVLKDRVDSEARQKVIEGIEKAGGTDILYATEPHIACCLLVDNSGSMSGAKIDEVNEALKHFGPSVCEDKLAAMRVDVCLIEFNTTANIVVPFCPITKFNPPELAAYGGTAMGAGIRLALEAVHDQVHKYHQAGIACFHPFVLMLTDGQPTDDVNGIETLIASREGEGRYGHLRFHAFGVQGADMDLLARISKRVLSIDKNAFAEVFDWTRKSMQVISNSVPDNQALGADLPPDMYPYDPKKKILPWND